jgi:hypothetical protein
MIALVEQVLGASFLTATAALVLLAIRRMLQHTIAFWGVRTARRITATIIEYEHRIAVQNLEPVPIDEELTMTIVEQDLPASWHSTLPWPQSSIRIYSGQTKPVFLETNALLSNDQGMQSAVRFDRMPAQDTWTVRVNTLARSVQLILTPHGAPFGRFNPLRPWLAITLSVDRITIKGELPVSRSPRALPTWRTAVMVATIGPVLYIAALVIYKLWFSHHPPLHYELLILDLPIIFFLSLVGFAWYRWIRRPVYPAIQSYTKKSGQSGYGARDLLTSEAPPDDASILSG